MGKIPISQWHRNGIEWPSDVETDGQDLELDCGTGKTLRLVQPVFDDIRVPVLSTRRGGSRFPGLAKFKDDGAGSQGVFFEWVDDDSEEELYFTLQLPHSYKYGTDLEPHVHWTPKVNGTAGQLVGWGLEYTFQEIGGDFADTTIIYANSHSPADSILVAGRHYLTAFAAISGASIDSVSAMMTCRIFWESTGTGTPDDLAQDAGLLEIDFHFQIDTLGSRTEYTK